MMLQEQLQQKSLQSPSFRISARGVQLQTTWNQIWKHQGGTQQQQQVVIIMVVESFCGQK
jgi:uncharacterized protein (DUF736 family)